VEAAACRLHYRYVIGAMGAALFLSLTYMKIAGQNEELKNSKYTGEELSYTIYTEAIRIYSVPVLRE